jgi:hypothetical protein
VLPTESHLIALFGDDPLEVALEVDAFDIIDTVESIESFHAECDAPGYDPAADYYAATMDDDNLPFYDDAMNLAVTV